MIVRNSPFPSQVINPQNDNKKVSDKDKEPEVTPDSKPESPAPTEEVNKVSDIKKRVEDGSYQIDINKSADKMAQDLLLDIRVYRDSQNSQGV